MRSALFIFLYVYLLTSHGGENINESVDSPILKLAVESKPTDINKVDVNQQRTSQLPPIQFKENSSIVVDAGAAEIGDLLATEIKSSLGWTFKVIENVPLNGQYIHLSLGCDKTPRDGFTHTSKTDRDVTLCASDIAGLKFAVFDFVERHLGVRWLFPAPNDLGTYRPTKSTLTVSRLQRTHTPAYINRRFSHGRVSEDYHTWADHLRMTTSQSSFHHNLYNLFPPSKYRLSRPEFYPVHENGIRYPEKQYVGACKTDKSLCKEENHRWQPVLTANGITNEAVKNIRAYFDKHPDKEWYSLGMNDSVVWGKKQQQGKSLNSLRYVDMSDYFFPWVNKVAAKVGETHPRARFGLLAYHNLVDPPTDKLNDRVVPYVTYDRMQWADPARRQADRDRTKIWSNRTNELGWYDYVYGDQIFRGGPDVFYSAPRVYPHLMAEYLRFGRDQGVRHYYAEAYPSTENWREGPKLYVLAKLLWDPELDVDALLLDWYQAAVGDGAIYLSNYYARWESFWTERVPHTHWFKSNRSDYLNFTKHGYLLALTAEDQSYLQTQMNGLKASTRGTQFEARANFFIKAWDLVNKQSFFGPQFEFEKGSLPRGFETIFEDSIEGTVGKVPTGWKFWNRPNVGSEVESGLSAEHASKGNHSFMIRLTATDENEAYAVLFRSASVSSHTKYCLKAKVRAPGNTHTLSLSFKRADDTNQTFKREKSYPAKEGWRNSAVCAEVPANNDLAEVIAWLGMKTSDPGVTEAWFDEIELYSKP